MTGTRDFFVGILVGSAIGAAAALLYARQSGIETRQQLKDKTNQALDKTNELASQARGRANELVSQAQTRVSDMTSQARTKIDDLSGQAQGMIDRGRQMVDQQTDAVKTAIDAGKQAYMEKQTQLQQEVAQDVQPANPTPA